MPDFPPPNAKWAFTTMSIGELKVIADAAGWRGQDINIAAAVAKAESGGKCAAIGGPNSDGTYDLGCWQINYGAHRAKFEGNDWSNPATNGRMGYAVWSERGGDKWSAWSVYNSGAYKQFLGEAEGTSFEDIARDKLDELPGNPLIPGSNLGDPLAGITGPLGGIGALIFKAGAWLGDPDNWVRVGQAAIGAALVVAGVAIIARPAVGAVGGPIAKALT